MTIILSAIEAAILGFLVYLSVYDIRHHRVTNRSVLLFLPAESSDTNMPMLFGVAIGALVVMAVVIVVIFKGRSKTSE